MADIRASSFSGCGIPLIEATNETGACLPHNAQQAASNAVNRTERWPYFEPLQLPPSVHSDGAVVVSLRSPYRQGEGHRGIVLPVCRRRMGRSMGRDFSIRLARQLVRLTRIKSACRRSGWSRSLPDPPVGSAGSPNIALPVAIDFRHWRIEPSHIRDRRFRHSRGACLLPLISENQRSAPCLVR